jgi:ubiquinone/menaquinone biosynthesis C-methylase UbiE
MATRKKKTGTKTGAAKKPPPKKAAARKGRPGYLHGYSSKEAGRLRVQARVTESRVHDRLPFRRCRRLLEVGSGVGAQTEILLRHFPDLFITGVEHNVSQVAAATDYLATIPWSKDRFEIRHEDAMHLSFSRDSFDSAFLCWILEHVPDPARALAEARRVLVPGSPIVVTEVLNSSFFVDPYSPNTWKYWMAFNDYQVELGGDPFVGAKLGNLLQANGYRDIQTEVKVYLLDNREPAERADFLTFWTELLQSGAPQLVAKQLVSSRVVEGMARELDRVAHDPNSVFFYAFIQARARA